MHPTSGVRGQRTLCAVPWTPLLCIYYSVALKVLLHAGQVFFPGRTEAARILALQRGHAIISAAVITSRPQCLHTRASILITSAQWGQRLAWRCCSCSDSMFFVFVSNIATTISPISGLKRNAKKKYPTTEWPFFPAQLPTNRHRRNQTTSVMSSSIFFSLSFLHNVTGQGTRHLVAGTLDPLVRPLLVFVRIRLLL